MNTDNRGNTVVLVDWDKMKFHFTTQPLAGSDNNCWYPFEGEGTLFSDIEKAMIKGAVAHNVVSLIELRKCGCSTDFKVVYNKIV